jgi:hypothetical protein
LGLGLSIAQRLAYLHGGRIEAASPGEGKGATFTLLLPVILAGSDGDERPADAAAGDASEARLSRLAGLRVLVVDDHADGREIAERVLRDAGADVASAMDAASAMSLVDARTFDVLVCDIAMPDEDGYSLIRKLRSRTDAEGGRIPAVALTAYARGEDRKRSLLAGFQGHIAKPAEPTELLALIGSLVGRTGVAGGSHQLA